MEIDSGNPRLETTGRLQWIARLLGMPVLAFNLFWVYFALNSPFAQSASLTDPVMLALLLPMVGYIIAWFRPGAGAALMLIGAVAVAAAFYPRSLSPNTASFPVLFALFCLPHLVLSILFYLAARLRSIQG
jgi:hypothetical protein